MPRELICTEPMKLAWREYDVPPLGTGQVRVCPEFGSPKHGTEMAMFKGYGLGRGPFDDEYNVLERDKAEGGAGPWAMGNMIVGTVEEIGSEVSKLKVGDRVAFYGPLKEACVVGENECIIMPGGMSWKNAVCVDSADFAFGAVRDGHVRIGDAVAVFGLGAIGLMVVQFALLAGANPVIALDPLAIRLEAADALGAATTLDPTACDAGLELKRLTNKRGMDVAIDFSGATEALQDALRGIAYGGNVVCGSFPPPYKAGLDFGAESHINVPNIIFSRACSAPDRDHPRWHFDRIRENTWRLLSEGVVTGEPIVQPVVPFDNLLTEYAKIATNPEQNIKLGVEF